MVPFPLATGNFVPVVEAHGRFNVTTSGVGIPAFGANLTPPPGRHLFADLRCDPTRGLAAPVGAQGAGFFDGKFVSGVGRTLEAPPAAPNRARAVARELLYGAWFQRAWAEHPASKRRPPPLRYCDGALFRGPMAELEAISLRPGLFCRFSNLVWLGHRIDFFRNKGSATLTLPQFVRTFLREVGLQTSPEPDALARAVEGAFERAIESAQLLWGLGFAFARTRIPLDTHGTLLSLGDFALLEHPFVGETLAESGASGEPTRSWALLVRDFRSLAWFLRTRFHAISRAGAPLTDIERDYCAAVSSAFSASMHPLFDDDSLVAEFCSQMSKELNAPTPTDGPLAQRLRADLRTLVAHTSPGGLTSSEQKVERVPVRGASFSFAAASPPKAASIAEEIETGLEDVFAAAELEGFVSRLRQLLGHVNATGRGTHSPSGGPG